MDKTGITKQQAYKELHTSLALCRDVSVFLGISPDDVLVRKIAGHLQTDLPQWHTRQLEIGETENNFILFFKELAAVSDKQGQIVHLTGVENLPETGLPDFVGYLQSAGDMMSGPTALVLWVRPEFERDFFLDFPDTWQTFAPPYIFQEMPDDETAAEAMPSPVPLTDIPPEQVTAALQRLLAQYEVRTQGQSFLIREMAENDLHRYYVPTWFINKKGQVFTMEQLVRLFLRDETVNFLTILGFEGAGKTCFLVHCFMERVREYLQAAEKPQIPVFISLKDYPGRLGMDDFLTAHFNRIFGINLSHMTLQNLLLRGRFVFFIDGFDRMVSASDRYLAVSHIEELNRLALKNIILENGVEKPWPANKVVLTCPPHYILNRVREDDTAQAGYTVLYQDYAEKENHRLVVISAPRRLNDEQFREYVLENAGDSITARNVLGMVRNESLVNTISTSALLREMVLRTVRTWRLKKEITPADLYRAYTDFWIQRDDWRFRLKPEGKRAFLDQLALRFFHKDKTGQGVHFSEMDPPDPNHIKEEGQYPGADPCRTEALACEFLIRDPEGNYRFVHRSFMDYFLARLCLDKLRAGQPFPVAYGQILQSGREFLKQVIMSEKACLGSLNLSGLDLSGANLYQAVLARTRFNRTVLDNAILAGADLQGAEMAGAEMNNVQLMRANLTQADMSNAVLAGARLRQTDLSGANLNGANLRGADLRGAILREAKMAWADLREADLEGADLTGAHLSDADLRNARLNQAVLNEADLTGADLGHAVLAGAQANSARFYKANLVHADISGASMTWSRFRGAVFSYANLKNARFRSAGMSHARLNDVDAAQADFRWADLRHTCFDNARMREADLTGADLHGATLEGADLSWANLSRTRLEEANLTEANLNMSKFIQASLRRTVLKNADLTWADMGRADLRDAVLTGTILDEADLTGARIDGTDFSKASLEGTHFQGTETDENEPSSGNADATKKTPADEDRNTDGTDTGK